MASRIIHPKYRFTCRILGFNSMPKAQSSLLKLIDAESDDEFASSQLDIRPIKPTTTTAQKKGKDKMPAAKKATGRAAATKKTTAAANKVTKPAQKKTTSSGRRASGRIAPAIENTPEFQEIIADKPAKAKAPPKPRGRKPAAAKEIEVDMEEVEDSIVVTPQPAVKTKGGRGRPKKAVVEQEEVTEIQETQQTPVKPAPPARRGRKPKARVEEVVEIPETQQPQEDEEMADPEPEMSIEVEEEEHFVPGAFPAEAVARNARRPGKGAVPRRAAPKGAPVEDPIVDDEEEDSGVYQKPGRTTRVPARYLDDDMASGTPRRSQGLSLEERYKNLENRHRDVRETAVRDAERNFDRLKKQSEEKAAVADKLIAAAKAELAALKIELSAQKKQVTQSISEKSKLEASYKAELDRSAAENKQLKTQVSNLTRSLAEVTKSLSDAKTESKNLVNKLAAARTTEATKAAVPSSAMKPKPGSGSRQANNDALHAARQMQLKEDMYADLTALIVRGVKKEGDDDVFDCLQTGPNGSKSPLPTPPFSQIP